ncbi:MAG TPA: hypothetical protein VFE25_06370, partial [Opitutaceae bacterium]|nr:hypothetical protein [Opitutaceae bacterium]
RGDSSDSTQKRSQNLLIAIIDKKSCLSNRLDLVRNDAAGALQLPGPKLTNGKVRQTRRDYY